MNRNLTITEAKTVIRMAVVLHDMSKSGYVPGAIMDLRTRKISMLRKYNELKGIDKSNYPFSAFLNASLSKLEDFKHINDQRYGTNSRN